jgi:hypothetical protein
MKDISTLVQDIRSRLLSTDPIDPATTDVFGTSLARLVADRITNNYGRASLRLSNLGTPCDRKLWYTINKPEQSEPLSASVRLKFLFGDIIEQLLLFLARATGHTVSNEQAEVDLHGVRGHIDAVIDGELVDVKSASSYSFKKFRSGGLEGDDPFGYRTQLNGYLTALSRTDNATVNPDRAHFLVVDKTLGHICLDTHSKVDVDYAQMVESRRAMLSWPTPPDRGYADVPDGASGNRRLGMECSYCPFKSTCWEGLRVFAYSNRPVFLTRVVRQPKVQELTLEEAQED